MSDLSPVAAAAAAGQETPSTAVAMDTTPTLESTPVVADEATITNAAAAAPTPSVESSPAVAVAAPPTGSAAKKPKPKRTNKATKRKAADLAATAAAFAAAAGGGGDADVEAAINRKTVKKKKKHKEKEGKGSEDAAKKKPRKKIPKTATTQEGLSQAQIAANEQMRRVLEEDQYSANGSIVDTDSEGEETFTYRNETIRMDRAALMAAMRKHLWMGRLSSSSGSGNVVSPKVGGPGGGGGGGDDGDDDNDNRRGGRKKKKKNKRSNNNSKDDDNGMEGDEEPVQTSRTPDAIANTDVTAPDVTDDFDDRDGSIFGATAGSSNATWVECDKCKKWRRLRGVVDAKKLPSRWYCSMNKNDPDRSRCSAPEEEYETPHTPESAADARTRKHLRVWVRRLQCNEAYESRQPTLTRGRKKATASTSTEPYEWIRCCNQSCGKWRAILRIMDAKTSVIERTSDGEWYCVMNTWDEKTASCAAPQENLPAIGCPSWVNQDEK